MANGVHALVFSKDRAMQLDAFLTSAQRYAPYATLTVIGSVSDGAFEHDESYHICCGAHPYAVFYADWQGGFGELLERWLTEHERVVFHTDDDVFFRPAPKYPQPGLTMRLGRNTSFCHPLNRTQWIPEAFPWRWRESDADFGYPLSLNATVYNSADLLPLLNFPFSNPTELEARLACQASVWPHEWMDAMTHSCCVSLPHNVVSTSSGCPRGANPEWQPDALCKKYLEGWRIDLDAMDFTKIEAAHQEVPLRFRHV